MLFYRYSVLFPALTSPLQTESTGVKAIILESGLNDRHHLIYSMVKTTFEKEEPKLILYHDYMTLSDDNFQLHLEHHLQILSSTCAQFEETFERLLNIHY